MSRLFCLVVLGLGLLSACGAEKTKQPVEKKSMFDQTVEPQLDALEKAQEIEGLIEKQKVEIDRKISEQGP